MRSVWEQEALVRADVAVIGSGIVGLSTALSLKEAAPTRDVLVIERGLLPTGASTRNAGFVSVSTLSEVLVDEQRIGLEQVLANLDKRRRGIDILRRRLGDEAIRFRPVGSYELLMAKDLPVLDHLTRINALTRDLFGDALYSLRSDALESFGFDRATVKALILDKSGGSIHTGEMMRAFIDKARALGVRFMTGAEVTSLEDHGNGVELRVSPWQKSSGRASEPQALSVTARHVAVCTNAAMTQLIPEIKIRPGRGQVLITNELPDLPWDGTFNYDEGFYYFRRLGDRIIFGGGRNLDFETETTQEFALNERIQAHLEDVLARVIIPGRPFEVAHRWSGIMGFAEDYLPFTRRRSANVVVGFGCNSVGVSMGSTIGAETAALLS